MSTKDLGLVTAYGYAKEGGFQGTESQFKALLGNVANDLAEIENISASAETLDPGESATATYTSGALAFGIPEGLPGRGIVSIAKTAESGAVKTYTMTFTDSTTFTFDVTDGEVTDDSLAETLEDYAKVDGYYQDMSVGDAEQLVSTIFEEDSTPYLFRTSGGSIDIGDREYDEIVGGSVAWNQRIKNGDFSNGTTNWDKGASADTFAVADGVATLTLGSKPTNYFGHNIQQGGLNLSDATGHKVFICASVKSSRGGSLCIAMPNATPASVLSKEVTQNAWASIANIVNLSSGSHPIQISTGYNYADNEIGDTISAKYVNCIDLTQMLGSTIADYIYTLETANAGAGVAWFKKLFPKPYYAYNAGELLSVSGLESHDMVGFNALSQNIVIGKRWQNGVYGDSPSNKYCASPAKIEVVPNTTYCISAKDISANAYAYIACFDANGNWDGLDYIGAGVLMTTSQPYHTFTTRENTHFITATLYRSTDFTSAEVAEVNINLSWDGERDGEYEEYVKHSYALDDSLTLRGIPKLDVNNKLYYDGDTYKADGTVTRKYGIVDMGSLEWSYLTDATCFQAAIGGLKKIDSNSNPANIICGKYVTTALWVGFNDKCIAQTAGDTTRIRIKDSAYTDAATFKTAMSGVYLVYELATPTTESADSFTNPQIVDDFGTEDYAIDSDIAVPIPVGHNTKYTPNLRAKLEMLPNSPDSDGDYIVRHTSGESAFVLLEKELPSLPTEDGTYHLKCTVSSGTATLAWESEE